MTTYQTTFHHETITAQSVGGLWANEAPIPARLHGCQPHTRGRTGGTALTLRCACGGVSRDGGHTWTNRNSRRKQAKPGRHKTLAGA